MDIEQFEQLAAQPDLGQNRQDIKSGYYSKLVGRHLIFYRKIEHRIRIIRVLHQAMDMPQHLTKS